MDKNIRVPASKPIHCAMTEAQFHDLMRPIYEAEGLLDLLLFKIKEEMADHSIEVAVGIVERNVTKARELLDAALDNTREVAAAPHEEYRHV